MLQEKNNSSFKHLLPFLLLHESRIITMDGLTGSLFFLVNIKSLSILSFPPRNSVLPFTNLREILTYHVYLQAFIDAKKASLRFWLFKSTFSFIENSPGWPDSHRLYSKVSKQQKWRCSVYQIWPRAMDPLTSGKSRRQIFKRLVLVSSLLFSV